MEFSAGPIPMALLEPMPALDPLDQAEFEGYIGEKARLLLEWGVERYRDEDSFGQPSGDLTSEQLAGLLDSARQLGAGRGFCNDTPLDGVGINGCYVVVRTFHFKMTDRRSNNSGDGMIDEIRVADSDGFIRGALFNRVRYNR